MKNTKGKRKEEDVLTEENIRNAVRILREENKAEKFFYGALLYCKNCKTVHLFDSKTNFSEHEALF